MTNGEGIGGYSKIELEKTDNSSRVNSVIAIIMALLLGGGVIYFLIDEIPNGTILDGNIEDWEGIPRIELETGNLSNSNIDLEFIAAQTDSVYLSLLTMTSEPLFYSDNGDLLRIFIDTDNTTETGYFV
ncbi:hypothetical protein OAJ54_00220, partial [Marine Group III euryarchaeote]|nr:hypothetical protein [Marine Group III euryarchaeote]